MKHDETIGTIRSINPIVNDVNVVKNDRMKLLCALEHI